MCVSRAPKNVTEIFFLEYEKRIAFAFRSTQLKWFANINRSSLHEFHLNCTENRIKSKPNQNSITFKWMDLLTCSAFARYAVMQAHTTSIEIL